MNIKEQRSIKSILEENTLCSISTISMNNNSWIHTCFFSYDTDFSIFYVSSENSNHSKNILVNSSAAATIFDSSQKSGESLKGLQLFGEINMIDNYINISKAFSNYSKRFLDFSTAFSSAKEFFSSDAKIYCFSPVNIKILDEEVFGKKTEVNVSISDI